MKKIHITLVGGQTMPVYNGIKYTNPDKVVFVYSQESEKYLGNIKKEFDNIEFVNTAPLTSSKLDKILERAKEYRELYKNDEVSINISGGTKPWSYYFSKVFEDLPNVKIFYIDQNNKVGDLISRNITEIDVEPLVQFRLSNNPLKFYTDYSTYTSEDFEQINKIEEIRKIDKDIFKQLSNLDKNRESQLKNPKGKFVIKNSFVEWNKDDNSIKVNIVKPNKNKVEVLCSDNIFNIFFNTAWFELKVANLLSSWNRVKEMYLNCKFPPQIKKGNFEDQFPKNEIDIIVNVGSKLIFVECKTHIFTSTDIDKFKNAVRNYGGQSAKALFVVENGIGVKELEKMKESHIIPFSIKENKKNGDVQEQLIKLLETEMFRLNE